MLAYTSLFKMSLSLGVISGFMALGFQSLSSIEPEKIDELTSGTPQTYFRSAAQGRPYAGVRWKTMESEPCVLWQEDTLTRVAHRARSRCTSHAGIVISSYLDNQKLEHGVCSVAVLCQLPSAPLE